MIQRGLAAGLSLYAPAVVLSVILGWPDRWTTVLMGVLIVTYTSIGGIKAVTWADVQQMMLILCALVLALLMAVHLLPAEFRSGSGFARGRRRKAKCGDHAFRLERPLQRLERADRRDVPALAYFGCDQSQVQRYLTGKSIAQSRLSLIFNAMAKIPMQFFILFIGAMVFVFFIFEKPAGAIPAGGTGPRRKSDPRFPSVEQRYEQAFAERKQAAEEYLQCERESGGAAAICSAIRTRSAN